MLDLVVRHGLPHAKRAVMMRDDPKFNIPSWGLALLVVTGVFFFVAMSVVEYALRILVPALAMVETPSAVITVSAPKETATGEEKEGLLETAPETTLIHQKPITSSIRATLGHLRSHHGRMAYLKGLRHACLYTVAFSISQLLLRGVLFLVLPTSLAVFVAVPLAGALCAPLHAAWTSKVVSQESDVKFWQHIPARSSWKVLALPAAIYTASPYVLMGVVVGLGCLLKLDGTKSELSVLLGLAGLFVITIALAILVYVPMMATMIRIEASLMSEDLDTIVPFDRTFAGKVVSQSLGGTGVLGFKDAWKSFDGEARRRVVKLFVKFFAIMFFMSIIMFHTLIAEAFLIMGAAFGPAMKQAMDRAN